MTVLTPDFFQSMPIELADGAWYTESDGPTAEVSVIAAGGAAEEFPVGDIVSVLLMNSNGSDDGYDPTPAAAINVRIIGVLAKPAFFLSLRASASSLTASDLFTSNGGCRFAYAENWRSCLASYLCMAETDR